MEWNFLVSNNDIKYNFVFTPCWQSPLCFTCAILAYSSKTLHQSSKIFVEHVVLGYSFEPRLNSRALCTVWPSVYQSETYARTWIPVWREKTILTSSEVRGSLTSKAWRQFSSALKMTNDAVPSIAFVINSVNGGRFLEFIEPNWKVYCTIF